MTFCSSVFVTDLLIPFLFFQVIWLDSMADMTWVKETRSLLMRNTVGQENCVDCHSDIKMLDRVGIGIHLCDC